MLHLKQNRSLHYKAKTKYKCIYPVKLARHRGIMSQTKHIDPKWWVLLAVGTGSFMSALDGSVVNTILPVIEKAFSSNVTTVEWVVTVYLLVLSGLLLTFGRLGDLHGHKSVYVWGFGIFVISSAICGAAPSTGLLIIFRGI